MFAKISIKLVLVISLFFSTQVFAVMSPAEMTKGECAKMQCAMGCCANTACCGVMEQHQAPKPICETSQAGLQFAPIRLRNFTPLYFLPPAPLSFAIRDDGNAGHTPPPLAVNCIRLI